VDSLKIVPALGVAPFTPLVVPWKLPSVASSSPASEHPQVAAYFVSAAGVSGRDP